MSFLHGLGGAGAAAGAAGASAANPLASGLGNLFGTSGGHISDIANRVGTGMNMVASAGGAQPGYGGQAAPQGEAGGSVDNHMQLLDNETLAKLVAQFKPHGAQF